MEKSELKHLAGYLLYGLKGITQKRIVKIQGFELGVELPLIWGDINSGFTGRCDFGFKPILRPLSDLAKEIEVNGQKFIPNIKLDWNDGNNTCYSDILKWISIADYFKLLEWHFDIYGLIEKSLAIDINTLK